MAIVGSNSLAANAGISSTPDIHGNCEQVCLDLKLRLLRRQRWKAGAYSFWQPRFAKAILEQRRVAHRGQSKRIL
jgi:hypothetical protein